MPGHDEGPLLCKLPLVWIVPLCIEVKKMEMKNFFSSIVKTFNVTKIMRRKDLK